MRFGYCSSRGRQKGKTSRQEVVERVETYMRAHMTDPVPLSELCRIVGLSERGLRNAFYGERGMSPKRYMLAERLRVVRRALSDSDSQSTTVTSVATYYGFYELGRFAASYKEAFGEAPSETLRRSCRGFAVRQTSTTRGHADACTF
jgi:AraC family ethanolamine operon transcriptional activator